MFSNNQKISARQLKRLMVMDWLGKMSLFLPFIGGQVSGNDFIFSILLATIATICYTLLICYLVKGIQINFTEYLTRRFGRFVSILISCIYWIYMYVNLIFIVRAFGAVSEKFILPETSSNVTCMLLLLGGVYAALEPKERRGRLGEVLYPIIIYPLLVFFIIAAFHMYPGYLTAGNVKFSVGTLKHAALAFAAFGGVSFLLFESPYLQDAHIKKKAAVKGVAMVGVGAMAIFLVCIGTFGEAGMKALNWPVVTLMCNVEIPGKFLGRFDVIFLALFIMSFFVAVSTGFHYLHLILSEMSEQKKTQIMYLPILIVVAIGVLITGTYETALSMFRIVNCYLMVPVMLGFTLLLSVVEWEKRRKNHAKNMDGDAASM